ncbi:hypothetical protein GBA52_005451 [Prunus armeniaca]|nr:hypothetical protein GBA52_005451 [Prunus armeniaca]
MTTVVHISINSLAFRLSSLHNDIYKKPIKYYSVSRTKIGCLKQNRFKVRAYWERWSSLGGGSCPNCGNDFQIFKSALNDDLQQCPFCTQPFSVVDNKFVMDSVKYSNQSTTFGQAFNDYTRSTRGKESSKAVVDIEAEVKDAD